VHVKATARVVENIKYREDVHILRLTFNGIEDFSFFPGQYVILTPQGSDVGRAYSIANYSTRKQYLEFCIRRVEGGRVSPVLCSLEKEAKVEVKGPFGNFFVRDSDVGKNKLFISTGVGIAPIKAMLEYLLGERGDPGKIRLLVGARKVEDVIYREFLEEVTKKHSNVELEISQNLAESVRKIEDRDYDVFICSSPALVKELVELCKKMGFRSVRFEACILSSNLEEFILKLLRL
jgi:NAD(P)H-flavin reductase